MTSKVLVVYASKYGSTQEIAEAIGKELAAQDLDVTVQAADQPADVAAFDAVVVGSGIYAGNWMGSAVEFIENNTELLSKKSVWLFSSGPTGDGDPVEILGGWQFPEALHGIVDRIAPRETRVFHGNIDIDKINWGERNLVRAMKGNTGDFRNWDLIRAWAQQIAQAISS